MELIATHEEHPIYFAEGNLPALATAPLERLPKYFTCAFFLHDRDWNRDDLKSVIRRLLDAGAAYLQFYGKRSEEAELIADGLIVARFGEDETDKNVIMTTSQGRSEAQGVAFDVLLMGIPTAQAYKDWDGYLLISVGSETDNDEVKQVFSHPKESIARALETVSVTFMPSESEIEGGLRWVNWRARRAGVIFFVFIEFVLILIAILRGSIWVPMSAGLGAGIIVFVAVMNGRIHKQATKQFKAAQADGESSYTFSDNGLRIESKRNNSTTAWESFEKAQESDQLIFLTFPNGFSLFIPHQRFSSGQWIELRSLLRNKLGVAAKLR